MKHVFSQGYTAYANRNLSEVRTFKTLKLQILLNSIKQKVLSLAD